MPTRSDPRASAPENGSDRYGASTSKQSDHIAIKIHGGASNGRQQDDVRESGVGDADQGREEPETKEDIDERKKWVESIQKKLQDYTRSEPPEAETIFIPRVLKVSGQGVENAYEPRVISIGPYHQKKPHLKNMQKRKWQCLKDILVLDLHHLFKELKKVEERARSFYPESKTKLNRGKFLKMLLLDGCFIVDYLARDKSKTKIWSDDQIRNDMLLLENQLPFFVVEYIYCSVKHMNDNKKLVENAVKFCHDISPKKLGVFKQEERNFKHLLHLYHAYIFFDEHNGWEDIKASQVQEEEASQVRTVPSATLLQEAGIKFKKRKNLVDKTINVRFIDGVMHMTHLVIDAFTISQFLNLIKFEQAHPDMEPRFTAFLQFMDCIINTSEDVALLRKNDILDHAFGSDEEVAGIFNQLNSGTFHQLSWELKKVYEDTNKHCKNNWNRWWATLLRDHFGSPWAAMAILATVLLLSFESIQAFFSVYSYFRPCSAP